MGALVLAVCLFALRLPRRAAKVSLDYLGITLMAAAVSANVLVAEWGGSTYSQSSPVILGLAAGGVASWVLFFFAGARAAQPVIPLWLFPQPDLHRRHHDQPDRSRHRPVLGHQLPADLPADGLLFALGLILPFLLPEKKLADTATGTAASTKHPGEMAAPLEPRMPEDELTRA